MAIIGLSDIRDAAELYEARKVQFIGFIDHAAQTIDSGRITGVELLEVNKDVLRFTFLGREYQLRFRFTPPKVAEICLYVIDAFDQISISLIAKFQIQHPGKVEVLRNNDRLDIMLEHEEILGHFLMAATMSGAAK